MLPWITNKKTDSKSPITPSSVGYSQKAINRTSFIDQKEPTVDIFQSGLDVVIVAHFDGLMRDEIAVKMNPKEITFTVKEPQDKEQLKRMGYYSAEIARMYGWTKTFPLPSTVDTSTVKHTWKNGVMEIRAEKKR